MEWMSVAPRRSETRVPNALITLMAWRFTVVRLTEWNMCHSEFHGYGCWFPRSLCNGLSMFFPLYVDSSSKPLFLALIGREKGLRPYLMIGHFYRLTMPLRILVGSALVKRKPVMYSTLLLPVNGCLSSRQMSLYSRPTNNTVAIFLSTIWMTNRSMHSPTAEVRGKSRVKFTRRKD